MHTLNRTSIERAVALAALGWSAVRARDHRVSNSEERVFRVANDASDRIEWPVWAVMQSGSLAAVFVATGAAARHPGVSRTSAPIIASAGTAMWGGIKLVKPLIGRGRPEHHLASVNVRGAAQTGLGYPSGHAAVSTTLALLLTRSGPGRRMGIAIAGATGVARMYAGAHLPLDVVGGFCMGRLASEAVDQLSDRWRL